MEHTLKPHPKKDPAIEGQSNAWQKVIVICLVSLGVGGLIWFAWLAPTRTVSTNQTTSPPDRETSYFKLQRESDRLALAGNYPQALKKEAQALDLCARLVDEQKQLLTGCQSLERMSRLSMATGDLPGALEFRKQLIDRLSRVGTTDARHDRELQQSVTQYLDSLEIDDSRYEQLALASQLELQAAIHDFHERPFQAIEKLKQATDIYNQVCGDDNLLSALIAPRLIEHRLRCFGIENASDEIDTVEKVLSSHLGSDHRQVLELMHLRATDYEVLGDAAQAAEVYRLFFAKADGILDDDDPVMVNALIMLSFALARDGKFVGATRGFDRAENIINTSSPNPVHDLTRLNFFRMDLHMGKGTVAEAVELGESSIQELEKQIDSHQRPWNRPSNESLKRLMAGLLQRTAKCIQYNPLKQKLADQKKHFLAKKNRSLNYLIRAQEILESLNLKKTLRYVWVMRDRCEHCYMESSKGFYEADWKAARQFVEEGIAIYEGLTANGNAYQMPRLFNQLGNVFRDMGSPASAMEYYQEAIDCVPDSSLGSSMLAMTLRNKAIAHHLLGQKNQAVECLVRTIELNSTTFFPTLLEHDESEAIWLTDQFRRNLYDLFEVIDEQDPQHLAIAFEYLSRVKGIVSRSISTRSRVLNDNEAEDLGEEYRKVTQEITAASFGESDAAHLKELTARKRELVTRVREYVSETNSKFETFAVDRLGGLLPEGTALVECFWQLRSDGLVDTRKFFAFTLYNTNDQTRLGLVNLGPASAIDDLVRSIYEPAYSGDSNDMRGSGEGLTHRDVSAQKAMLKKVVWDKIESSIGDCKTVLFCGDGSLNQVSWCELPGSEPDKMLLDEYKISWLGNARRAIELLSADASTAHDVVIFGGMDYGQPPTGSPIQYPTLRHTLSEVRKAGQYFQADKVTLLSGLDVTKPKVIENLERARAAYFATHGVVLEEENTAHPFSRCALILSNANVAPQRIEDFCLSGEEITAMDLVNLELVILSACSSASGIEVEGEGIAGLQKAFMLAGARSCLASMWTVKDKEAREFMSFFADNLFRKRLTRTESLRQAQIEMRNKGYPSRSWANWRLMGDWR